MFSTLTEKVPWPVQLCLNVDFAEGYKGRPEAGRHCVEGYAG